MQGEELQKMKSGSGQLFHYFLHLAKKKKYIPKKKEKENKQLQDSFIVEKGLGTSNLYDDFVPRGVG